MFLLLLRVSRFFSHLDPTCPFIKIEKEDEEFHVKSLLGTVIKYLWLLPSENKASSTGEDISSKTVIWRCNHFVLQRMKAVYAIDYSAGRDNFNFNKSLLNVTENDLTDAF